MPTSHLSRATLPATVLALTLAVSACGEDPEQPESAATSSSPTAATTSQGGESPTRSPRPEAVQLSVTVSGGEVSPTGEAVELPKGDPLVVRVTSDRAGELHVHSTPEQYVEFGQGTTRRQLIFGQPGQVDIEEHDTGALVARVLVR